MFSELASALALVRAIAAAKPWQPTLAGEGEPERFEGQRVSAGYFRVLGVSPALGREFDAAEDRADGAAVVSPHRRALAAPRFGADPAASDARSRWTASPTRHRRHGEGFETCWRLRRGVGAAPVRPVAGAARGGTIWT